MIIIYRKKVYKKNYIEKSEVEEKVPEVPKSDSLNTHESKIIENDDKKGPKPQTIKFTCDQCSKTFSFSAAFKKHKTFSHELS